MELYDGLFFLYMPVLLIPAVVLGIREKRRDIYICILSAAVLFLLCHGNDDFLKQTLLFCIFEISIIFLYGFIRDKIGREQIIFYFALAWACLPLIIFKLDGIYGKETIYVIGISYVTFRILQILIEIHDGLIDNVSICGVFSFLFFFPTLSSGPIDRSRRFDADVKKIYKKNEYIDCLSSGLIKIFIGVFYKYALSEVAYYYMEIVYGHVYPEFNPVYMVAYAYLYGFYLFFDFAGYSLMAIGTSYCLGIKVPENFNKPFISVDLKDFWNRWHISLSHWLRDYVFSRFIIKATKKKWFAQRDSVAVCGYIINMLIMGMWHGLTFDYILYGLYHGILLAITDLYQKKSGFYKRNKLKAWYKGVSWFFTMNAVMFGFLIFSGKIKLMIMYVI